MHFISFQNLYPVNYLRNVALSSAATPYAFLTDIDFLPGSNAYENIRTEIGRQFRTKDKSHQDNSTPDKLALVVPAFETQRYRLTDFPRTKAELADLLDLGTILTFRLDLLPLAN